MPNPPNCKDSVEDCFGFVTCHGSIQKVPPSCTEEDSNKGADGMKTLAERQNGKWILQEAFFFREMVWREARKLGKLGGRNCLTFGWKSCQKQTSFAREAIYNKVEEKSLGKVLAPQEGNGMLGPAVTVTLCGFFFSRDKFWREARQLAKLGAHNCLTFGEKIVKSRCYSLARPSTK